MGILVQIVVGSTEDALRRLTLLARSDESVRAENLVLRRQLAKFIERGIRPARRLTVSFSSRGCTESVPGGASDARVRDAGTPNFTSWCFPGVVEP